MIFTGIPRSREKWPSGVLEHLDIREEDSNQPSRPVGANGAGL